MPQLASARPFAQRAPFRRLSVTDTPWITDALPSDDQIVSVLATAEGVRYVLPFPCKCVGGTWVNATSGSVLQVAVAGWCRSTPGRAPQ